MSFELDEKTKIFLCKLDALAIAYKNYFHEPAYTVEGSRHLHDKIPGGHSKSLFLKTKKNNNYFLVVMHCDDKVNLKKLSQEIGKGSLSFASPESLKDILDLEPGSVTPFGVINDHERQVTVVLDRKLLKYEFVNFHPLRNDITTSLASNDLLVFLRAQNHEPIISDIPVLPGSL